MLATSTVNFEERDLLVPGCPRPQDALGGSAFSHRHAQPASSGGVREERQQSSDDAVPSALPWLRDVLCPAVRSVRDLGVWVFLPTSSGTQDLALLLQREAVPGPAGRRHAADGSPG